MVVGLLLTAMSNSDFLEREDGRLFNRTVVLSDPLDLRGVNIHLLRNTETRWNLYRCREERSLEPVPLGRCLLSGF